MSRSIRCSNSEQTSKNRNKFNFYSDGDISNKRHMLGNSSQFHTDSSKVPNVLNKDSIDTVEDENPQWFRNLSLDDGVSLPTNLRSINENVNKNNNSSEKKLSENELDESHNESDEDIFLKKIIFGSQEQRNQNRRYSKAFNLNIEKPEEEISELQKIEVEELQNQLEQDEITGSSTSNVAKGTKKKRRTKSIFPKKAVTRRYYDLFVDNTEPEDAKEAYKDQLVQQDDSTDDTTEKLEDKPKETLFKLNPKKKKYSEAFFEPVEKSPEKEDIAKKIVDLSVDNQSEESSKIEEKVTLFKTNIKRKKYSEAFLAHSSSKTLHSDVDKSRSEKEIDDLDETSVEQPRIKKSLFQRNTRSKRFSEAFLAHSSSKTLHVDKSQSEKEIDANDDKHIEQSSIKKSLIQRITRSKQHSEAFLGPSISKTLHSGDENPQSETEVDKPVRVLVTSQENSKTFSQAFANVEAGEQNKENTQTEIVSSQEIHLKQRESLNQIKSNNTKYSQANLELEKKHNNVSIIKNVENNEPDKEKPNKENDNDITTFASISSINVSDEIKHPLFRPQARRSLYSVKSTEKDNEEKSIQSTHEPQQQDVQNSKRQKVKRKRISLRSSSTESGISKFFDESLISSTKYFINPNEGTGSEESGIKKRRSLKSVSNERDGNNIKNLKDDKQTSQRRTPLRKDRNSKLLSTVTEHPDNILINENKMVEENKDIQSEEHIKDKNSTLKKGKNFGNKNKIVEENQQPQSEDQAQEKNSILKKRKSKSITSVAEIQGEDKNENFVLTSRKSVRSSENDTPESKMDEDNKSSTEQSEPMKNIISSLRSSQSSKFVTRVSDNFAQNTTENERTPDNTDNKQNKNIKKKRKRSTKSTSKVSQNSQNIVMDKYENIASDISKKSSVSRTRKSSAKTDENSNNTFKDVRDIETEELMRQTFSVSQTSRNTSAPENKRSADVNEHKKADEKVKDKNIDAKISKKSFYNFSEAPEEMTSDEDTDMIFIKKSWESIKSRKIQSSSMTSVADKILENIQEKASLQIESPVHMSSSSSNQKKLSTKSSIDRRTDPEAISGIITINTTIPKAGSSQNTNQNTDIWLSKSNVNKKIDENLNLGSIFKKRKIIKDKPSSLSSEDEMLERKQILINAGKTIEQKKLLPQAADKKITDFFSKLEKDEKLKPIPKKINNVKKTARPVCTARLINGKPYYKKKLFHGARWCSKKFYQHIQNKIRNEYGDDTINESENVMKYIVSSVNTVIKSKKYLKKEVDDLKKELARRGIISTTYDFYSFCFDYLPSEYRDLVVPRTQFGTDEPTVPYDENDTYKKIEF